MENLYDDDELEGFLRRKANPYRMYPSEKVWRGIYTALHTGRRWHIIGGTLLLLSILTLISLEKTVPAYKNSGVSAKKTNTMNVSSTLATTSNGQGAISLNSNLTEKHTAYLTSKQAKGKNLHRTQSQFNNLSVDTLQLVNPLIAQDIPAPLAKVPEERQIALAPMPEKEKKINWLEDKIINKLLPIQKKDLKIQFYLSPSISYRSLQKGDLSNSQYNPATNRGLNGLVNQAPALGLELGSALLLHITDKVMLKTGLQFNYARYNINAYRSSPEKTSITLTGAGYYSPPTTIITYSNLRTYSNGYPETIQNQYVQLSLPLGVEWKIAGGKRLQLNVAASVQPTYLLANNAYMLTSDLSSYTKEPSLVRKWNVNTGLETFISYNMGNLRWQIGPQFRYQLLSTYNDRYPIHEYLMEYGLKIGVSKTIK